MIASNRDEFHRPKSKGGLGIKRNEDVNKASLTKVRWSILIDRDSCYARIMNAKYIKDYNFNRISKKAGDSII